MLEVNFEARCGSFLRYALHFDPKLLTSVKLYRNYLCFVKKERKIGVQLHHNKQ